MKSACGFTHPSNLAKAIWRSKAIWRFSADVPIGYRGDYPNAPFRWTREAAEADACAALHQKGTAA